MYHPKPGYVWNPLKKYRNLPCPCGKGKKVKRCHGLFEAVPASEAKTLSDYLARLKEHGFVR